MRTRIVLLVVVLMFLGTAADAEHAANRQAGVRAPLKPIAEAVTPALSLNKRHEPNSTMTAWQVGLPIEYVVSVHNGGAATTHATITDTLPAGFVVSNISAIYAFGAAGPITLVPPAFGDFAIPTGGDVELHIKGYFTTAGLKVNTAEANRRISSDSDKGEGERRAGGRRDRKQGRRSRQHPRYEAPCRPVGREVRHRDFHDISRQGALRPDDQEQVRDSREPRRHPVGPR